MRAIFGDGIKAKEDLGVKKCFISINGCDDCTQFNIAATDEQYQFLLQLVKLSKETSVYSCMPTIEVYEALEE